MADNFTEDSRIPSTNSTSTTFVPNDTTLLWEVTWNGSAVAITITFVLIILLNGFTLIIFLKERHLRTAFNVYLMFLMISNMTFALLHHPLQVVELVAPKGWMGTRWCSLFQYSQNLFLGVEAYSHLLITVNRMWAISHPLSYRRLISTRAAIFSCIGALVYVHGILLYGFITDEMYYRLPLALYGCVTYRKIFDPWKSVTTLLVLDLPVVIILLAYPYIWWMRRRRNKIHQNLLTATNIPADNELSIWQTHEAEGGRKESFAVSGYRNRKSKGLLSNAEATVKSTLTKSRAFTVLTLMTLSIFCCWLPITIFGNILVFIDVSTVTVLAVVPYVSAISNFQAVADPIFFVIVMDDLRVAVRKSFRQWICRAAVFDDVGIKDWPVFRQFVMGDGLKSMHFFSKRSHLNSGNFANLCFKGKTVKVRETEKSFQTTESSLGVLKS